MYVHVYTCYQSQYSQFPDILRTTDTQYPFHLRFMARIITHNHIIQLMYVHICEMIPPCTCTMYLRIYMHGFFRNNFQGGGIGGANQCFEKQRGRRRLELKYIKLILMSFAACPSSASTCSSCLISHSAEKSTWRRQSFISNENCIGTCIDYC